MKAIEEAFGPLWKIFSKDSVHEIIVDSADDIYYEENGKIINCDEKIFSSSREITETIHRLIEFSGRTLKEGQYSINFVIDETTRIMCVLPPLSIKGPILNLIKIPQRQITWDDYLSFEAIDEKGKQVIEEIISDNKSILVAGPVGSGKTTLLNLLIDTIDKEQRVVTIEKMANLLINRKRVARLQTENNETSELVGLVNSARYMRGDYVILDDAQGPETMPFLSLLHEGHSGMMLIGAENAFDSLRRLELKALSSDFTGSIEDIRYAISSALDYVVFQEKCDDGKRRITRIGKIINDGNHLNLDIVYKA
jgi:pilus assembly protein CpaF